MVGVFARRVAFAKVDAARQSTGSFADCRCSHVAARPTRRFRSIRCRRALQGYVCERRAYDGRARLGSRSDCFTALAHQRSRHLGYEVSNFHGRSSRAAPRSLPSTVAVPAAFNFDILDYALLSEPDGVGFGEPGQRLLDLFRSRIHALDMVHDLVGQHRKSSRAIGVAMFDSLGGLLTRCWRYRSSPSALSLPARAVGRT